MEKELEAPTEGQPESPTVETSVNAGDTAPKNADEATVLIKFNKETRRIPVTEAAVLAQKGLKFDMISEEYGRLKNIAAKEGKSIGEWLTCIEKQRSDTRFAELLQKCGGDEELALHIKQLEDRADNATDGNLSELQRAFPEIKEIGELPSEVIEGAKLHGRNLLDEYLRYLLAIERARAASEKQRVRAAKSSVGGLGYNAAAYNDTAKTEFLSGIWSR